MSSSNENKKKQTEMFLTSINSLLVIELIFYLQCIIILKFILY